MKSAALLLAAIAIMPCAAQTTQKLTANKANEYALIYTLPNTVLDVTLEAEKTVRTPGEFYKYAKKYLNIDPILEPSVTWTLKSATVTPRGVADENERYQMQFKNGSTPFILINDQDFPLTINDDQYTPAAAPQLPQAVPAKPTILQTAAATQAVTEDMLKSTSSAKKAELAAAKIYELRQSRNDIISGQADGMPSDGKAMQLALDNLAQQEEALTAMFVGTTQVSTDVRTYTITPDEADRSHTVAARLSALKGLTDSDDLSGDPVYLDITVTERGKLPTNDKGEEKKFPKGGVAYRIPGQAQIGVTYNDRNYFNAPIQVAQYGIVFGIDPALFSDKKAPAYAIFDPTTGALKELGTK